jgi:predicted house-cleaning noncanonical NTP pyrophosphatase (MazG superfamily)
MALPPKGKLVRDLIPEIIKSSGKVPITCQVSGPDLIAALRVKAKEEVGELFEADNQQLLEEIADVYEVLRALVACENHTWSEIEEIAKHKRGERGGFEDGTWLIESLEKDIRADKQG